MTRSLPLVCLAACAVEVPQPLSDCQARDPIDVLEVSHDAEVLSVRVGHAEGCADHAYAICWPGQAVADSKPPQVALVVWHDDGGETCEAYGESTLTVDLTPVLDVAGPTVQLSVDGESLLVDVSSD